MPSPLKPLKWYHEMEERKARQEAGAFLVEGERAIRQIAENHPEAIREILSVETPPPSLQGYPTRTLTGRQLHAVSHTKTPPGIMALVSLPPDSYAAAPPEHTGDRVLLLEDIQDPGNVGTLIRTAAALDYNGVVLTEKCADPFAPKCVQATAGAVLSVWLRRTERYLEMAGNLKQGGFSLVAAELNGTFGPEALGGKEKILLALGNEAAGLSGELRAMADIRLKLPTAREKAESLNVAACGAILMYLSHRG